MSEIEYERRCPSCWYCGDSYEGMPAYEAEDVDGDMEWRNVCAYHTSTVTCGHCGREQWRPENMAIPTGWLQISDRGFVCPTCA